MGNRAMVLGLARSGIAASELLRKRGWEVLACDIKDRASFGSALDGIEAEGALLVLGEREPEKLLEGIDMLVVSPGIPLSHPAVVRAKALGVEVVGEVEYAYREACGRLLALTGTNGKTTTVTLLGEIFKSAGFTTHVVGNIGKPYSAAVLNMKPEDVTVCEISSFMMETSSRFHPQVSAVLNISEDHLNRHGTMANYIALKERIFENQTADEFTVLNYDDPVTRDMAKRTPARVAWFSEGPAVDYGACVQESWIVFGESGDALQICPVNELRIPGRHNLQNALAATAMAMCAGVDAQCVRRALATFQGVEHRIEFVRELDGVRFINDSKGTNVDSSIWAVRAMDRPTVIILGGYDKHADFTPLCEEMLKYPIERAVLIGVTAKQYEETLERVGFHSWEHAGSDFEYAVRRAFELADNGWNVLLSPGCASFDMFDDYEARGRIFKELVNRLNSRSA